MGDSGSDRGGKKNIYDIEDSGERKERLLLLWVVTM